LESYNAISRWRYFIEMAMTVKELIEKLQEFDGELPVCNFEFQEIDSADLMEGYYKSNEKLIPIWIEEACVCL
jgi:hypothetical protein